MNFSTNQVKQLYVLKSGSVVTYPTTGDKKYLVIDNERTDLIDKVLKTTLANADDASQVMKRKGVLVALNSTVNSGAPVAGQHYRIKLTYRGHVGEEDTYHKFAEVMATSGMTAAQLLQGLAKSLIAQIGVEASPLYEIYLKGADASKSTKITTEAGCDSITASGFYIVEPVPYWALGKFPESLMKIELTASTITVGGVEENDWLANTKFTPIDTTTIASVAGIVNSHKVADLEYFCKGERGTSAGLHAPYDIQLPLGLKVNPDEEDGYDILNIHYAYQGANQQSTLSEKDITLVIPADGTITLNGTASKTLADLKTAVEAF